MDVKTSLSRVGRNVERGLARAWSSLAEGWRELWQRSGGALTRFVRKENGNIDADLPAYFPHWGLMAGEVIAADREIIVRLEAPGLEPKDYEVFVENGELVLRGEKRMAREAGDETYYVMERAYGKFERRIPLPAEIDAGRAQAVYRHGVITVRLPRHDVERIRRIAVH